MPNIKRTQEVFTIVERALKKLGFIKDIEDYLDFKEGNQSIVKFIDKSDSKRTITLNMDYKLSNRALLWTTKMPKTQEKEILNIILVQLYRKLLSYVQEDSVNERC